LLRDLVRRRAPHHPSGPVPPFPPGTGSHPPARPTGRAPGPGCARERHAQGRCIQHGPSARKTGRPRRRPIHRKGWYLAMSNSPSAKDPATPNASSPERPEDEKLPPRLLFVYGLQHILTMYAGAVAPALVIGSAAGIANDPASMGILVSGALLVAGIATLMQSVGHRRISAQMPIVVACSFVPVSAITSLAAGEKGENLPVAFGASLVAGVFALCVTPFFGQLIRFFPPVVTGTIITVIGVSLMPVAADWILEDRSEEHTSELQSR